MSEQEIDELESILDSVPEPLEPLDVSMLDGYLCGVLIQPMRVPISQWLTFVTDVEGGVLPPRFDVTRLRELATRRYDELNDAIARRQWFDPWVFELEGDDEQAPADDGFGDEGAEDSASIDAVYPWVAGFATALDLFPELMKRDAKALTEPLALVYRHLSPDDLEDADDLLEEIESLEPPVDLSEAVEGLVRATLLLADVGRPVIAVKTNTPRGPQRFGGRRPPRR